MGILFFILGVGCWLNVRSQFQADASLTVSSLYTWAERAHDVIGMGCLEFGPILDVDGLWTFSTQADDLIADCGVRHLFQRNGGVVHGEAAEDWAGNAMYQDVAAVGEGER